MVFNFVSNIDYYCIAVPQLAYFSHIPTAIIALILGFFVFFKTKKNNLASKILLFVAVSFSLWATLDLILWTSNDSRKIMFAWSIINFVEIIASMSTLYFSYVFLEKNDVSLKTKVIVGFFLGLFAIFIPTTFNLTGFSVPSCESQEGILKYYFYFIEVFFSFWLLIYLIKKILSSRGNDRKIKIFFSIGVFCFLFSFSGTNIIASITGNWEILQYGLFGMPMFMAFLIYLIIEYRIFNIRLLAAQGLVVSIILLVASQFFFIQNQTSRLLVAIILFLVSFFGWWLVRSVKKEYDQKEELRLANIELKKLDQAKSEFINIASHQLRTPITVIQGVASMMIDGDIDKMPLKERQKFYESVWVKSKKLQTIIHDILNATKLDNKDSVMDRKSENIDLGALLDKVVRDFQIEASERDIELTLNKPKEGVPSIRGQQEYLEEVFINLINNAIKYTPSSKLTNDVRKIREDDMKAKIVVNIKEDSDTNSIVIAVKDNGIGISPSAASNLFKKFSRAENAVKMYTDGTGLELYIVKEIVEDHGGRVWFKSKLNKGTTFFVSLPIYSEKISDVRNRILNKDKK